MLFTFSNATSSIEQFNKDYYTQICKKLIACKTSYSVAETLMLMEVKDVNDCVQKVSSRDSASTWKTSLSNKKIEFNPKNIVHCLESITKLSCKTIASRIVKPSAIKGCETVIIGSIADYKKCASHLECSGTETSCYDTCEPPLGLLQCGETLGEELCDTSQYCDTKQHKCFAIKKIGEKCDKFSACETGNCSNNICQDYPSVRKAGEACGREFSNVCTMGYYCSDDTNKCVAF
jgi:hypothetical protein